MSELAAYLLAAWILLVLARRGRGTPPAPSAVVALQAWTAAHAVILALGIATPGRPWEGFWPVPSTENLHFHHLRKPWGWEELPSTWTAASRRWGFPGAYGGLELALYVGLPWAGIVAGRPEVRAWLRRKIRSAFRTRLGSSGLLEASLALVVNPGGFCRRHAFVLWFGWLAAHLALFFQGLDSPQPGAHWGFWPLPWGDARYGWGPGWFSPETYDATELVVYVACPWAFLAARAYARRARSRKTVEADGSPPW